MLLACGLLSLVSIPAHGQVIDISGVWDFRTLGSVDCTIEGERITERPSGSGSVGIEQNGTTIAYTAQRGIRRTGTIDGTTVCVSGPLAIPLDQGFATVTITSNQFSACGSLSPNRSQLPLNGSGSAAGTICVEGECAGFSCSATDQTTLSRPLLTVRRSGTCDGTVSSTPAGIACGTDCEEGFARGRAVTLAASPNAGATFARWSGACQGSGGCTVTPNGPTTVVAEFACASPLVAAVLPISRSVQVNTPATVFATMINGGASSATMCRPLLASSISASFRFFATDPATNTVVGAADAPVNLAVGAAGTFLLEVKPTAPIAPTDLQFSFACADLPPASSIPGVNTLLFSASVNRAPDVIALVATVTNDGIVTTSGASRIGAFSVSSVNVGAAGNIVASLDTGDTSLPLAMILCRTNSSTAACLAAPRPTVSTSLGEAATATFSIFVTATGNIPFDPARHRVFVRFRDSGGVTRGSTSVAVRTP